MQLQCSSQFFFFQAEDGIRDLTVTGVQTCALPIWGEAAGRVHALVFLNCCRKTNRLLHCSMIPIVAAWHPNRSEERRVGKEWRQRWVQLPSEGNGKNGIIYL